MSEHKPNECPACVAGLWVPNCTWTETYPEAEPVAYLDPIRAEEAEARETAALKRAEVAEARVDQLTDELAEQKAFNEQRSEALNRTGTTNDTLRAQLAAIRTLLSHLHTDLVYAGDIRAILDDPGPES